MNNNVLTERDREIGTVDLIKDLQINLPLRLKIQQQLPSLRFKVLNILRLV